MIQLREKMQRVVTQVFRLCAARMGTSHDEHTAIVAAVVDGNGARAAELIARHLELGKRLILSPPQLTRGTGPARVRMA
jgi:DNA-binding GntR family transcriptional regulator